MKFKCFVIVFIFCFGACIYAQNTIGLISYDKGSSYEGYNLIFPHNQPNVYLFDNCGEIVNIWEDVDVVPGNSAYLTNEGHLVKCTRRLTSAVNDPIWAGGGGEFIDIRTWENDPVALFMLNDSMMRLHHDIAVMPNGHILMIAWELKSLDESLAAGRDPSLISQDKLWPEAVLEWDPELDSIVWEWHVWDHLIQEYDSTKNNFGIVGDHPELVDINYDEHDGHPDWLHINAIDYNSNLDQIVLSVPYFNEFWIIDHSTTLVEASTHTGGLYNKGGDILYRWGNPQTYQNGDSLDQKLFFQHDVHWIDGNTGPGGEHSNEILLYNNRVGNNLSTTNSLELPWDQLSGSYQLSSDAYGPDDFKVSITHPNNDIRASSTGLSSAQLLPNNNFLICSGRWGYSYEVTPGQEIVWEYITPIIRGSRAMQGDTSLSIGLNLTFRNKRYSPDFEGFSDKNISPDGFIELNPDTLFCQNLTTSTFIPTLSNINIFPNPASDFLNVEMETFGDIEIQIFDVHGRKLMSISNKALLENIDISFLQKGVYFLKTSSGHIIRFLKI